MSTNDDMQFELASDGKSIQISRQYAASLSKVWDAWTTADILDQWWAPQPWQSVTKSFDFSEGGKWLYCMKGPEGEEAWGIFFYDNITAPTSYAGRDRFADADGNIQHNLPGMHWQLHFHENEVGTRVDILIEGDSATAIQKHIDMGFREGFTMGLNNLANWLSEN
ncbi:SRPBCC domain-containing protein [Sphingobacterium oryzagri]|uniref:SRPBCC domain-containing protein n=1 Tax=Sphingobacterium oryzagri TaxID=3025669 RepID=A0ABY7WM64_9SPHI|nr:SRPBCC domain-containing protein [Sphingobacterium sp. KACC 22765]WDF70268.1 SRPBCC domain-containing protein [Sphingobacterium sp. KACC 22765]